MSRGGHHLGGVAFAALENVAISRHFGVNFSYDLTHDLSGRGGRRGCRPPTAAAVVVVDENGPRPRSPRSPRSRTTTRPRG